MLGYKILDIFFMVFHTILIIFILFGWIWSKSRRLNLLIILLTAASWTILGIFYGFGYCPLTDWHFSVLEKLGHTGLPSSYIKYIADRLTGSDFEQRLVDIMTMLGLAGSLFISLYLNIRSGLFRRKG